MGSERSIKDAIAPWQMSDWDRIKATMLEENTSLFPALVEALSKREIVYDDAIGKEFCLTSWMIKGFTQEVFDELHSHFFNGAFNDIRISKIASDVAQKGVFTYALFNEVALSYYTAKKLVQKRNRDVDALLKSTQPQ